jgi:hypothetical protein
MKLSWRLQRHSRPLLPNLKGHHTTTDIRTGVVVNSEQVCKQCGLQLPSLALYPAELKNSAGGYLNLVETDPQKVLDSIRVGMSQVNDQIQSTLGRF